MPEEEKREHEKRSEQSRQYERQKLIEEIRKELERMKAFIRDGRSDQSSKAK
jgi:hypothetical protein